MPEKTSYEVGDSAPGCRRCGTCCLKGGPTLQPDDRELLERGALRMSDLYTLRVGEIAYDNPHDALVTLERELIKIKEREGSKACMFLEQSGDGCAIYENRPLQCRALKCWNTSELEKTLLTPGLTRSAVLPAELPLLSVMRAHDTQCSPRKIRALLDEEAADSVSETELKKMAHYDELLRAKMVEEFRIPADQLDFLFGRPLHIIINSIRAHVRRRPNSYS